MSKRKRDRKSPGGPGRPLAVTAPARQAGSRRGGKTDAIIHCGGRVSLVVVRRGRFDKDDVESVNTNATQDRLVARRRGSLARQPDGSVARVADGATQDRQHEIVCGERAERTIHEPGATAVRRPNEERHA